MNCSQGKDFQCVAGASARRPVPREVTAAPVAPALPGRMGPAISLHRKMQEKITERHSQTHSLSSKIKHALKIRVKRAVLFTGLD